MGNGKSMPAEQLDGRQRRRRQQLDVYDAPNANSIRMPMPESSELEIRFTKVLASMDLPPDKAKLLKQYDDARKWDIICDQEKVIAKESPAFYLKKMRTYLDPKASRSAKRRKTLGASTSTQVLKDLEISLRTNNIEWVKEFLDEENKGLEVLIDYLSFRLVLMRTEQIAIKASSVESDSNSNLSDGNIPNYGKLPGHSHNTWPTTLQLDTPKMKRASKHIAKLKMGESTDDIHVCIMCLRAIMNNKYGFNMVIEHTEVINCIALSLNHHSLRTKALVLELLAAICLVKGGHQIILHAFDNFKEVCSENNRFQTLMHHFMNYQVFHISFMVACMQFINIVVHSVEDMNFRIHLQFEFTKLGLDDFLEKLRHTGSDELQVQISAYLDNVFDVAGLMEDSETKSAALERVAELEDQLSMMHERYQELENEAENKQLELEAQINSIILERNKLMELHKETDEELHTLRKVVSKQKEESQNRQSLLESKIQELETITNSLPRDAAKSAATKVGTSAGNASATTAVPVPPPPPAPPLAPAPPPPPPPLIPGPPAPPPPPGMMAPPGDAMTIKKRVHTKYKLPTLNWIVLKPNQVKGTVFNDLDDDKLHSVIDFNSFEELFKIGNANAFADRTDDVQGSKRFKGPEKKSVLDHKRLRNMAISLRKIALPNDAVVRAINNIDLQVLSLDSIEILLRMIPTEKETKAYRELERQHTPVDSLTDEDKFLFQLTKVERLAQKLNIMNYISNFDENVQTITPQVQAVIAASRSIKNSKKVRKMLEIVLAFGNYMNSNKRGPAYGFKLQSLDTLLDTKSCDKKLTLLHFIVETVKKKIPEAANFDSELRFIEKASSVSLDNILVDVQELQKGMELCKKEFTLRKKDPKENPILKDFLTPAEDKLKRLNSDMKAAQESYSDVVEFFGESSRSVASNSFFATFSKFTKAYKQAEEENEYRRKMEQAAREAQNRPDSVNKKNEINNRKNQQDAVINELKTMTRQVNEKRLLKQDEVYNGALEDILLGLKNEPYRRADAVRRSQRRKQENVRLSRNFDDLEV